MPRVRKDASAEEGMIADLPPKPRRTPRRRVALAEVPSEPVAPSDVEDTKMAPDVPRPPRRKAPARIAAETAPVATSENRTASTRAHNKTVSGRYTLVITAAVLVLCVGISAALGISDTGTIDVGAKLQAHNVTAAASAAGQDGETTIQNVPVQTTPSTLPNGGLQGQGNGSKPPPPPVEQPIASTTASTTEALASTTESVATTTPAETLGDVSASSTEPAPEGGTP